MELYSNGHSSSRRETRILDLMIWVQLSDYHLEATGSILHTVVELEDQKWTNVASSTTKELGRLGMTLGGGCGALKPPIFCFGVFLCSQAFN